MKKKAISATDLRKKVIKQTITDLLDGDTVKNKPLIDLLVSVETDRIFFQEISKKFVNELHESEEK